MTSVTCSSGSPSILHRQSFGFHLRTPRTKPAPSSATSNAMERRSTPSQEAHHDAKDGYKPYDTLNDTGKAGLVGGASGLFIASIRNALAKRNIGALSVFTRGAPIIGLASTLPDLTLPIGAS